MVKAKYSLIHKYIRVLAIGKSENARGTKKINCLVSLIFVFIKKLNLKFININFKDQ